MKCSINVGGRAKPNAYPTSIAAKPSRWVVWRVKNNGSSPLTVSIAGFRPFKKGECFDSNPFDDGSRLWVRVPGNGSGEIHGRVRAGAHYPRTYKYDVLIGKKIAIDPDIEIERP